MMSLIISRGSLCSLWSSRGSSLGYTGTGITDYYTLFADLRLTIRTRARGRGKPYLKLPKEATQCCDTPQGSRKLKGIDLVETKTLIYGNTPYAYTLIRFVAYTLICRYTPIRLYAYWRPKPLSGWRYNVHIPHHGAVGEGLSFFSPNAFILLRYVSILHRNL
jgi:hypothetical protein